MKHGESVSATRLRGARDISAVLAAVLGTCLVFAGGPSLCCKCSEPPILVTGPSGGQTVCVGQTVTFHVSAVDEDLVPDTPFPACEKTPDDVTFTWSGGGTPAGGTGEDFATQWSTPGVKTVKVVACDAGDPVDDEEDVIREVQVTVVEVASVAGPEDCLFCPGKNCTFTATTNPGGHTDLLTWSGGGTPATGTGGSFTTQWATGGQKTVSACCCGTCRSASITIEGPCAYTSCGTVACLANESTTGTLSGCAIGKTEPEVDGPTIEFCFLCPEANWHPVVTKLEVKSKITYDSRNRTSVDNLYTCAAVIWVDHEYDYIVSLGEGPCDQECDPQTWQCQFYSPRCLQTHEEAHAAYACDRTQYYGNLFISGVEGFSIGSDEACTATEAKDEFAESIELAYQAMMDAINADLAAHGEYNAYGAEAACLLELRDELCDVVGPSCTWCE